MASWKTLENLLTEEQRELLAQCVLELLKTGWGKLEIEAGDHQLKKYYVGKEGLFPKNT